MIDKSQLQEWERLANEATEGPWHFSEYSSLCQFHGTQNAAFICAAREAVPVLITEVRELRETLRQETNNLMDALNQIKRHREESEEAQQILGKALGYPPYPICNGLDHRENPAIKTDEADSDFVCVGDNTLLSLCDEAADKVRTLAQGVLDD